MPTTIRFRVLSLATVVAFLMYLDRICLAQIISSDSFQKNIVLEPWQIDWVKGAFFWAYALAQVPAGWLSDRFGTRMLITIYIATWSLFTFATGFSTGFLTLMIARLGCGLAEAGYYPASSGLLTRWAHIEWRGLASSMITLGGRVGGALAPWLTAFVILQANDWRFAGWSYGLLGIGVAMAYWRVFREHPRQHPGCNEAEIALLAEGRGDFLPVKEPPHRFPFFAAVGSFNLWMINLFQFLTNIGWAFLVLSLPDYLKKIVHLDEATTGKITTVALSIGILSLPLGGIITDVCSRKFGKRLGRKMPLALTRFLAAGCYLAAMSTESQWLMAIAFGGVAFFADLALPATWAVMQDISGKHQAQLFGWSNMWGNFGAALQPVMFAYVIKQFDHAHDYHPGIWLQAGAFIIAGFVAFFIDAERPVVADET